MKCRFSIIVLSIIIIFMAGYSVTTQNLIIKIPEKNPAV